MSAYTVLRLLHSYWRWAVLVAAFIVARALVGMTTRRPWTTADQRAARLFLTTLDVQFVLGIVLSWVRPFWMSTLQSFRETMQAPVARFFGIEHETAMVLAMAAVHVGWARAARAADARRKYPRTYNRHAADFLRHCRMGHSLAGARGGTPAIPHDVLTFLIQAAAAARRASLRRRCGLTKSSAKLQIPLARLDMA